MPRSLDVAARRREVTIAAMDLLARGGGKALTIKALAEELGGSTTLVTHIFKRKEDIYSAVADHVAQSVRESVPPLAGDDDILDLRRFIEWCIPLEPGDLEYERLRFALLERADHDPSVQVLTDTIDARIRDALVERLRPLVDETRLQDCVDFCRALTNGAILSVVEHPDTWNADRQLAVVELVLAGLGLSYSTARRRQNVAR